MQKLHLQEDELSETVSAFGLLSFFIPYTDILSLHPNKLLLVDTVSALLLDTTVLKLVLAKGALTSLNTKIN